MSNEDERKIEEDLKASIKQIDEIEKEYFAYRDAGGEEINDFVEDAYIKHRDAGRKTKAVE